jgi:hypothetical protein
MPWDLTGNTGITPTTNFLGTRDNQPLAIRTNNTEKVRVTPSGNLGIGTTNPTRTLDIAASTGSTELVIRDNSRPVDQRAWRLMNNTQVLSIEAVTDALSGGKNVINFTRNALIGIGTKSPQYALHLKTEWGILGLDTQGVNQHSGIRLHENGAVKWHIWNDGSATGNRLNINSDTGLGMQIAQDGTAGFGRDIRLETPNGATIYARSRLHVHGEELLYILNKAGAVIGKEWGGNGNLSVQGNVTVGGDVMLTGADCAEDFDVASAGAEIEPGTVMVIDEEGALKPSEQPYDKRVAGIISGGSDYRPGIVLDKRESEANRMPVALMGKVACKVEAQESPIEVGDLLTTASTTPGYAMKATDPSKASGAVIGKALQRLVEGQGLISVLVSLQ